MLAVFTGLRFELIKAYSTNIITKNFEFFLMGQTRKKKKKKERKKERKKGKGFWVIAAPPGRRDWLTT